MLTDFDPTQFQLLGSGGEAHVYALDDERVLRVYGNGTSLAAAQSRARLLDEIAHGAQRLPFATPIVLSCGELTVAEGEKRVYAVEKRIAGTSLLDALRTVAGEPRRRLIEQYMDAAWALGEVVVRRPYFGELDHWDPLSAETFTHYLAERARRSVTGTAFEHLDTQALSTELGEPMTEPTFVHLDYFAGNVMADAGRITAVIDFGYSSIIGDRRMNVVAAAAHLMSARITPVVTEADRAVARDWLQARGLTDYYAAGERWMAAYWLFVRDDPTVVAWAHEILGS